MGPSWDAFGLHFGMVLEVKIDANIDPSENVKIVFWPLRESRHEHSEASLKTSKIDAKTCSKTCLQNVNKISPKLMQYFFFSQPNTNHNPIHKAENTTPLRGSTAQAEASEGVLGEVSLTQIICH